MGDWSSVRVCVCARERELASACDCLNARFEQGRGGLWVELADPRISDWHACVLSALRQGHVRADFTHTNKEDKATFLSRLTALKVSQEVQTEYPSPPQRLMLGRQISLQTSSVKTRTDRTDDKKRTHWCWLPIVLIVTGVTLTYLREKKKI